ncbi:hypothetical protein [Streptomyces sp. T028]|uniref:hypothetical protein n=1 Tax=Streptomyces sp. T028 TaxID=3394379 RepID=UPI003A869EF0
MNPGFVCAPEMLPVPRLGGLSREQIAGKACVWCGCSPDDRIVLGPRISPRAGMVKRWFPSACQPCTGRKAVQVYRRHTTTCARCTHRDYCPDSHALHALALECR